MRYRPDGRLLAFCDGWSVGDVVLRVWHTDTWSIAHDFINSNPDGCVGLGFTPNGQELVWLHKNLFVNSVDTWQSLGGWQEDDFASFSLVISPDGKQPRQQYE